MVPRLELLVRSLRIAIQYIELRTKNIRIQFPEHF